MNLDVAAIKGDGVGPEMMKPALEALNKVCSLYGHKLNVQEVMASGEAIDIFYNPMPEMSLSVCRKVSAVLFGNTGLSKYRHLPLEKRPEYALMCLRKELEVTTNIRPVCLYEPLAELSPLKERIISRGVDFVFVRDIAGGVLCSEKVTSTGLHGREAFEYEYYNEQMVKNTSKIAFDLAQKRRKTIVSLDKSNVLESSRLWRKTIQETGNRYPQISLSHCYIDAAAMKILESPWHFDVIVTSNLFGDIISDEGTQITGTSGLYASAEVAKDGRGIYTPNQLHHPDESIIGKQIVNPIGMIGAAALMLRFTFGLEKEACAIERAVEKVISDGYSTKDIWFAGRVLSSTTEIGEEIVKNIREDFLK